MKALDQKLLRDLVSMKGQSAAIAAVIACGIAVFVMSITNLRSLTIAKDDYYSKHRFGDVFAGLVRAPVSLAERATRIDGVVEVDHRVVEAMTLDMPGMSEPATGQAISLPAVEGQGLNQIYLVSGRWPSSTKKGEVVVSQTFAVAHDLESGDELATTMRGQLEKLTVVGVALSPEYLMQVAPGSMFPDDKRFGVFWMSRRQLEAGADMKGAFNDISLQLSKDANEHEVVRKLDRLLAPYGCAGAFTRENQASATYMSDELAGLEVIGILPPLIFLGVAAFLLNISLRRILSLQREQVAALKAFGYTNWEISWHYGKLTGVIVLAGTLAGCVFGTMMAGGMLSMYQEFYHFPTATIEPALDIYLGALGMAFLAGLLGVYGGVRSTIKLPPAEAMRPEAPANYKQSVLEKFGMKHFLSQPARMVVREISRRPVKAMFTSLGISFSCAILIVGDFGKDSFDYLIDFQFGTAERDDARVQFVEAKPRRALHELERIDGVMRAEPFRSVGARLRNGARSKQLGIIGLAEGLELYRLLDKNGQVIPVKGDGILISKVLASKLDIKVGDEVQVEVLEGERPVKTAIISGLVEDFAGTSAYMNLTALNRLLGEGDSISGAYLMLDESKEDEVFSILKDRPGVAGVSLKKVMIASFMDTMAETMLSMRLFNIFFATVIAVGVVYSSARIAFSERSRDLATLRVIGLTRGEVSSIMLGELAVLTLMAIPLGLAMGYGLCRLMSMAMQTELYRLPFIIHPSTYGFASMIVLGASLVSGLIVRRKIDKLDMVSALKIRE